MITGQAMQKINHEKFLFLYANECCEPKESAKEGIKQILSFLEADERITDLRHAAYILATCKHETAKTYLPIKEYGKGQGRKYGIPDKVTGKVYFGRGYVQLTWKDNYKAMGDVLKLDLVHNPDLALVPENAYRIMSYGMRNGSFTGVGLNRFIHGDVCDYEGARKIINGVDCADRIAAYAQQIERFLNGSKEA